MTDATTPRLLYKGAADDTAETTTAIDADDLAAKRTDGWRLTRVDAKHQPPVETGTIEVPAQTLVTEHAKPDHAGKGGKK